MRKPPMFVSTGRPQETSPFPSDIQRSVTGSFTDQSLTGRTDALLVTQDVTHVTRDDRDARVDDIAERARRMHAAGHGLHDISAVLQVHPEQVRRWLATVEDEAAAAHARAWSKR